MRPSQKSNRSRGKSNRSKPMGNVVNRVFESAGPEGKVRGTPQQIIDKYEQLARDSQTSGDRVVAENFLQHAEHYARMLSTAQAEQQAQQAQQAKRDAEQERQQQNPGQGGGKRGDGQGQQDGGGKRDREEPQGAGGGLQTIDTRDEDDSPLVSTPEQPASEEGAQPSGEGGDQTAQGKPKPARRRRTRRSDKGGGDGSGGDGGSGGGQDVSDEAVSG